MTAVINKMLQNTNIVLTTSIYSSAGSVNKNCALKMWDFVDSEVFGFTNEQFNAFVNVELNCNY